MKPGLRLLNEAILSDREAFHEIALLLQHRSIDLDKEDLAALERWVDEEPLHSEGESESDWQDRVNWHRWRRLSIIPPSIRTPEQQQMATMLTAMMPELSNPDFLVWSSIGEMQLLPEAPDESNALIEAWNAGSPEQFAEFLLSFERPWGPLVSLLQEQPEQGAELASFLGPKHGDRLASFFSAYSRIANDSPIPGRIPWTALVDLMTRVEDAGFKDCPHTANEIARLIEIGCTNEGSRLPAELLRAAFDVMLAIAIEFAVALDVDSSSAGRITIHHQLNSIAGSAANAAMLCCW
jgi:hypothetical protein